MSGVPGQKSGGHNRKPAAVLKLTGQYRDDRHRDRPRTSPAPATPTTRAAPGDVAAGAATSAPAGLSDDSRRLWDRILSEYAIDSTPSLELLESALRSRDVAERARAVLEREGLTYPDRKKQPRAHPAAAIHRDARAAFVTTMRCLGFPDHGGE